jgi:hypothetical protein
VNVRVVGGVNVRGKHHKYMKTIKTWGGVNVRGKP